MLKFIDKYIGEIESLLKNIDNQKVFEVIQLIIEAYKNNKQIFIMGNGGSASTASHFACDLGKGTIIEGKDRFRVMSLNDNMALVTAFSNDYGYEHVFSEQLKNLINENDIVIAISASGNSPNIIEGINYAKEKSAKIIGFSGFSGGNLSEISDICIHVNSNNYGQVEDIHMVLCHLISQNIKKALAEEMEI